MKMVRTLAVGDIHGRIEALKQCLKRSKFNKDTDRLIVLGDVVDGGYNTYQVVEELLKIKKLIFIIGNHDEFWMNHIRSGWAEEVWIQQGGANTLRSYGAKVKEADKISNSSYIDTKGLNIPVTHQEFFNKGKYYHIETIGGKKMVFVHGGFNPYKHIRYSKKDLLLWDRDLITFAVTNHISGYDKVFVGHTSTVGRFGVDKVVKLNNLYCLDTGAGWDGKLTIADVETGQAWQSDKQKPAIN